MKYFALLALLVASYAMAGPTMMCSDVSLAGQSLQSCYAVGGTYGTPTADSLVASRRVGDTSDWQGTSQWRRYGDLTAGFEVRTCAQDATTWPPETCATVNGVRHTWVEVVPAAVPVQPAEGKNWVTLSWTPATTNTDDSALTDLKGHWLYSAACGSPLGKQVFIAAPATTYRVEGLAQGCYDFALTATNAADTESAKSASVQATIAALPKVPGAPGNVVVIEVGIGE